MKTSLIKYKLGIESLSDIILHKINKIIFGSNRANSLKWDKLSIKLRKKYFHDGIWDFNGIRLPEYSDLPIDWFMHAIYMDIFFVFCNHNDDYNSKYIDQLDNYLYDGTFGYTNNEIDVTIKKNDIVIDAGAWIGDFSAYASYKGAKVYAFEPSQDTYKYLVKTQMMNPNINVIKKGLGNVTINAQITKKNDSWANTIVMENTKGNAAEDVEITTIDEFVIENDIPRIDFIKADIEGFERFMLLGATKVLKDHGPKLALCTYHLSDDPQVLSRIILEANPNYIIVQKRKKLYAMVNKGSRQS